MGRLRALCAGGLGLLCASGCPIVGDGEETTETRTIDDPIRRIEVFDGVAANVVLDPALAEGATTLTVRGDSNLLQRIITELHSTDILGLGLTATSETRPSSAPEIEVATASLEEAYVGGASSLTINGLSGEALVLDGRDGAIIRTVGSLNTVDADLRSDSALTLEGEAGTLALVTADASTVNASALMATDVMVFHGSSGDIRVCASGRVSGEMSGEGDLILLCPPEQVEVEVLGEGSIIHAPPPCSACST